MAAETPIEFPLYLYIYDREGYHDGKTVIHNKDELMAAFAGPIRIANLEKREVRITDSGDVMQLWMRNGQMVPDGTPIT